MATEGSAKFTSLEEAILERDSVWGRSRMFVLGGCVLTAVFAYILVRSGFAERDQVGMGIILAASALSAVGVVSIGWAPYLLRYASVHLRGKLLGHPKASAVSVLGAVLLMSVLMLDMTIFAWAVWFRDAPVLALAAVACVVLIITICMGFLHALADRLDGGKKGE